MRFYFICFKADGRAGRFYLSCKKSSCDLVQGKIPVSHYKFTMCLPKNPHIVVLSAILIFIFTIEASPVGNLDPIETALVENCLKNCEICENNFIDFLEGEFCRDTCVKGRGLIQKVHCNANGLSATIAPGMAEVLKILGSE